MPVALTRASLASVIKPSGLIATKESRLDSIIDRAASYACLASVYRDVGGKVLGVFAAARDVTNQNQAQRTIAPQQATALDRLAELEQFQKLVVGRELKMIELKKEIEHLKALLPPDEAEPSDPS